MKIYKRIMSVVLCAVLIFSVSAFSIAADENASSDITRLSVTVNGDTSSSRGICWYTEEKCESVVHIYKDGVDVTDSLTLDASCDEWQDEYFHKVLVSGLESATHYTFKVGTNESAAPGGSFTTDDKNGEVKFIAISDVQASNAKSFEKGAAVLEKAVSMMPDADFIANMGDFTNDSDNEQWDMYFDAFSRINSNYTLAPVAGNHDGLFKWNWFNNMFCLDTSESVQTLNGVNYSYDYGNAHFAVLNTNDLLSVSNSQLEWLENDMNSTSKDWKIVLMHKSPYSLGKDGKFPDALYLQQSLTAVLDKCSVDLVLSGHDHMYLRTKKLCSNAVDESGTVYVLSGTAGTKRYEIRSFSANTFLKTDFIDALSIQKEGYANYWNGTDWNSTRETNVGGCFNLITAKGGSLTLDSYILADEKDENGNDVVTKIDSFTLTKETGDNLPSFDGDNETNVVEYAANIVPTIANLAGFALTSWLPRFIIILPKILISYFRDGIF